MERQMAHITVPEIAARMGVSAATAKRRIAEWMLGTGSAPMRPGRAYVLTEQEFSQVMEYTRCRSTSLLQANAREIAPGYSEGESPESSERSRPSSGPVRRRGSYAKLRSKLNESFGPSTRPVVSLDLEKTRRSAKRLCNT
jgi:hypothetical protein